MRGGRIVSFVLLAAIFTLYAGPGNAISSAFSEKRTRAYTKVPQNAPVRPWSSQPYYGTVISGVPLGKVVAVSLQPPSPAANVCWYWTSEDRSHGYWDYCTPKPAP